MVKNSSKPSEEPYNLPSDEEFFASLVDCGWRVGVTGSLGAPAPATASPGGEGRGHRSGKDGSAVKLDPALFDLHLSLSDLLQVIRMEYRKGCGKE